MQEWLSSVSFEQNFTCVFVPLHLSLVQFMWHLPTFWIFSISRRRLETACWWLTLNCSASCFCICESSSSSNACNSTSSYFLGVFCIPCLQHRNLQFWNAETIVHTFFAMEHVHHKLLQSVWFRSSFLQMKTKNVVRECSLFGTNFVILNTATQYYANTF